jgi:phosphoribosylamine--glycine ligase
VLVWRGETDRDGSPRVVKNQKRVGEGLVPLTNSWHELLAFAKAGDTQGEPTVVLFDSTATTGIGNLADDARRAGLHVIGASKFGDRLEMDRAFGRSIALQAGIPSPRTMVFDSVDDCMALAKAGGVDREVYWKTDAYLDGDATHKCADSEDLADYLALIKRRGFNGRCLLEEKLDGFALSTQRWWNGSAWVGPYQWDIEHKAFMPGNVGPSTGCAFNAVGQYEEDEPTIAKMLRWDKLTHIFAQHDAAPGVYDINAIVNDGKVHFLEWCGRFGYDSEPAATLLYDDYSRWLWYIATGQGEDAAPQRADFVLTIRLTVPPAPFEHIDREDEGSAVGVYVRGETGDLWSGPFIGYELMHSEEDGLTVAAPEGLVGLSATVGDEIGEMAEEAQSWPKENLRVPGLGYWATGVGEQIIEDAQACADAGVDDLPRGLTR